MAVCLRCHRSLMDPVSVERMVGPHCWAVLQRESLQDVFSGWEEYPANEATDGLLSEKGPAA